MRWWYAPGAIVAGVVLAVAFGPRYLGYDAAWSLVWGGQLAGGHLPDYGVAFAPTPHPLANLIAASLSLLGDGGAGALGWLAFLAFGALAAGAWALGAEIGGVAGGIVAALLVATRSDLGREAAFASVDLPFLALVVWACAAAARRGPESALPLVLLLPAGLLRPEAWPLALAYGAWSLAERRRAARVGGAAAGAGGREARSALALVALALAAPVVWFVSDWIVTGDPLYSLHGTRDLAAALERPRGAGTALGSLDDGLRDLAGTLPALAGVLGAGLAVWAGRRRAALVALAAVGIGVAGFVALGAAGLPVLFRYLLAPATLLLVLAGGGFGATLRRSPAALGAAAVAMLLVLSVPATVDDLQRAGDFTALRAAVHDDLRAITRDPGFQRAAQECGQVMVPGFRARPLVLLDTDAPVRVGNLPDGVPGVVITYADEITAVIFNLGVSSEARRQAAPLGARTLADNGWWRAYAAC